MIETEKTKLALSIATKAHEGQVDKGGLPYILHPIHLAKEMDEEDACIVALLHDVVEDSPVTFEDLSPHFSPTILKALRLLTHREDEAYADYIKRLKTNPLAKKVKLADLRHNGNEERLAKAHISPEKRKSLTEKYQKAMDTLMTP